ncbi:hypothetical protein BC833DRAFT_600838 [Globomyces pollinis-pini]|nr:hypothetical protein BC833DRAFT_600838 [Globomyces pollinis-pini]
MCVQFYVVHMWIILGLVFGQVFPQDPLITDLTTINELSSTIITDVLSQPTNVIIMEPTFNLVPTNWDSIPNTVTNLNSPTVTSQSTPIASLFNNDNGVTLGMYIALIILASLLIIVGLFWMWFRFKNRSEKAPVANLKHPNAVSVRMPAKFTKPVDPGVYVYMVVGGKGDLVRVAD